MNSIRFLIRNMLREQFFNVNPYDLSDDNILEYINKLLINEWNKNYHNFDNFDIDEDEDGELIWKRGDLMISVSFKNNELIFHVFERDDTEDWNVIKSDKVFINDKLDFNEIEEKYLQKLFNIIFSLNNYNETDDD